MCKVHHFIVLIDAVHNGDGELYEQIGSRPHILAEWILRVAKEPFQVVAEDRLLRFLSKIKRP